MTLLSSNIHRHANDKPIKKGVKRCNITHFWCVLQVSNKMCSMLKYVKIMREALFFINTTLPRRENKKNKRI